MSGTERFVEDYRRFVAQSAVPGWLAPLREAAISRFAASGFPTTREEDWKYTNVARLVNVGFRPALDPGAAAAVAVPSLLGDGAAARLVFVNGRFADDASSESTRRRDSACEASRPPSPRGARVWSAT